MSDTRKKLIGEILSLDAETFGGIDDPAFLHGMTEQQLYDYYKEMVEALGE